MTEYATAPTPTWSDPEKPHDKLLLTDRELDGLVTLDGELVPNAERWCALRVNALLEAGR